MPSARHHLLPIAVLALALLVQGACALPTAEPTANGPSPVPSTVMTSPATVPAAPTSTSSPPEHRIGVRQVDGAGEFFDRRTGERFAPRGANLVRLAELPMIFGGSTRYHSTFNVGMYDPDRTEQTLAAMEALGYNTVRVFLDGNCRETCIGQLEGGLNPEYIANLTDFLTRAQAHGLVVLLTTDVFPATNEYVSVLDSTWSQDFVGGNSHFLREGGIRAYSKFLRELISDLRQAGAPMDAILAYQLSNEQFYGGEAPPFSLEQGLVEAANGETYDMSDPADKERMMEDGVIYWFDRVRSVILEQDPTALVTVGFFWPKDPHPSRIGDPRLVETERFLRESSADFVDLHPYPGVELELEEYVDNFKMEGVVAKPILLGEYGAATGSYPTAAAAAQALHDWQVESCQYGFDGWLHWTWDTDEDANFYHGQSGNGEINQVLAPAVRPDPCQPGEFQFFVRNLAEGRPVRTSGALEGELPENAVNGTTMDRWGAGAPPPQWIEIDLGSLETVGAIRLTVSQSPAGRTVHQIWGGDTRGSLSLLHTFDGQTADFDVLEYRPDAPLQSIRIVRVATTVSPSWVAWREIEVLAP